MLDLLFSSPLSFLFFALSLLVAITVHEFAHALVTDHLGDPTPRSQGRLSLNPLSHLDPLGTISMLLIGFGWGKPVPFDPYNLEKPRRDAALISLAGPASNLLVATLASLIFHFLGELFPLLSSLLLPLVYVNVMLAIFNLIPIGPLDGQKILLGILPRDLAYEFSSIMNRYGTLILIFFIFPIFGGTAPVTALISPIIQFLTGLLLGW